MSIKLWMVAVLALFLAGKLYSGAALFLRRTSIVQNGLNSYCPEVFVYREEHPVAYWIVIAVHSIALVFLLWRFW